MTYKSSKILEHLYQVLLDQVKTHGVKYIDFLRVFNASLDRRVGVALYLYTDV